MTIIPILLYHSVSATPAGWIAPFTVTPRAFTRHLDAVIESGRTAMTVSQLREVVLSGRNPPPRPVLLTFDDGFADFVQVSEVLASRGLPSTLYVTTGALRGRGLPDPDLALPPDDMLSWSQMGELGERGVEIGAHTHTHPQLDVLPPRAADEEIRRSKHLLEDALGRAVTSFAYPHGFHSRREVGLVQDAGYTSACAVMNSLSSDTDRPFALARLTVRADTDISLFRAWLAGGRARTAPYPEKVTTRAWRFYRKFQSAFPGECGRRKPRDFATDGDKEGDRARGE